LANKRYWRKRTLGEEWTPEGRVSEQELLNRVILAKALQVYASNQTLHFKTEKEDFEITPRVARDVIRASGQYPRKIRKKNRARL
jgi:hypothetical protein